MFRKKNGLYSKITGGIMNLQNMVKNVERLNDDAVLVEFNNNVARVYEQSEEGIIAGDVSAELERKREYGAMSQLFNGRCPRLVSNGKFECYFSRQTSDKVMSLAEEDWFYSQQVDKEIDNTFQEVVKELALEKRISRDWKEIGAGLGIGILSPVVTPLGLLASMVIAGPQNGTGPNLAMLALAPPVMGYQAVRELVKPRTEYLAMGHKEMITDENSDSYPAISFNGRAGKFSNMGLRFATGDIGCISPTYKTERREDEITAYIRPTHSVMRNYDQERYRNETLFLKLESDIHRRMNYLLEDRAVFPEVQEKFVAGLNRENQEALLMSIGFM